MDREEANGENVLTDTKLEAFSWWVCIEYAFKSIARPWSCHAQWICLFSVCKRSIFALNKLLIRLSFARVKLHKPSAYYVGQWLPTPSCPPGLCQAQQLKRDLAKPHNSVGEPLKNEEPRGFRAVRSNLWTLVVKPRRLSKVVPIQTTAELAVRIMDACWMPSQATRMPTTSSWIAGRQRGMSRVQDISDSVFQDWGTPRWIGGWPFLSLPVFFDNLGHLEPYSDASFSEALSSLIWHQVIIFLPNSSTSTDQSQSLLTNLKIFNTDSTPLWARGNLFATNGSWTRQR